MNFPDYPSLAAMFLLGLFGTGHCLGMCGPLVLALPSNHGVRGHLAYHLGRIFTYTIVGVLISAFGAGLRALAQSEGTDPLATVSRLQVIISIISALLLAAFGLARLGILNEPKMLAFAQPQKLPGFLKIQKRASKQGGPLSMALMGLILGLLPCGLSYAAFARVLTSDGPIHGGLLVGAFALGTLPGLLLLGTGAAPFFRKYQRVADLLAGILLIAMALSIGLDGFRVIFE